MYREQAWFDAFDFSYDMSVPNAAHLEPQRGGCCTVLPYFVGDVLELPLTTTQDYSLFHILGEYSMERWHNRRDPPREKWSGQLHHASRLPGRAGTRGTNSCLIPFTARPNETSDRFAGRGVTGGATGGA
jgi:hypothetical protein